LKEKHSDRKEAPRRRTRVFPICNKTYNASGKKGRLERPRLGARILAPNTGKGIVEPPLRDAKAAAQLKYETFSTGVINSANLVVQTTISKATPRRWRNIYFTFSIWQLSENGWRLP